MSILTRKSFLLVLKILIQNFNCPHGNVSFLNYEPQIAFFSKNINDISYYSNFKKDVNQTVNKLLRKKLSMFTKQECIECGIEEVTDRRFVYKTFKSFKHCPARQSANEKHN